MMSVSQLQIGVCHPVWKTVRNSPKDIEKAAIKARILTGTYTLQANRSKFNPRKLAYDQEVLQHL